MLLKVGDSNWNLELIKGRLLAVAKPGSGCVTCRFGDRDHIAYLMNTYNHDEYTEGWTEAGLTYLAGLQSVIVSRRVCFATKPPVMG